MATEVKARASHLIAEAHAAVLEQTQTNEFKAAPYERATQLLESLPTAGFVDDRVQLALDITRATRIDHRPDLSQRALYAAFPARGEIKDLRLKRKWFTFTAIVEAHRGNVERAFKYKLIALDLCEELKDALGFCAEWVNFSSLASGAGLYKDAERYATVAIEANGDTDRGWLDLRSNAFLSRANALMRLGHFTSAEPDLLSSLALVTYPPSAPVRSRVVMAQYLLAEIQLERGDLSAARTALYAASTWAEASDAPRYHLQVARVRARLSSFDFGLEQASYTLRELLEEAHDIETELGENVDEDSVLDVLHTLERVHREHGDTAAANEWLMAIGLKLRKNATKMVDALVDKPLLADSTTITAKTEEIDEYLQSRATKRPSMFVMASSSWTYLYGLAASVTGIEDPTKEHGVRVARLANLVARALAVPAALQEGIEAGCLVHGVGKVSVPALILTKQMTLHPDELALYDAHPEVGSELLQRIKHPAQGIIRNVVRFHHCRYDGSTDLFHHLRGDAIPLEARIASVCDEYDSLVTGRPRRPPITSGDALREIFEQRARKFDPKVVDVFVELVRDLERTQPDLQAYLSEDADRMEYFAIQRTLKRAAERADERLGVSRT